MAHLTKTPKILGINTPKIIIGKKSHETRKRRNFYVNNPLFFSSVAKLFYSASLSQQKGTTTISME